jgi:hypothetical protein
MMNISDSAASGALTNHKLSHLLDGLRLKLLQSPADKITTGMIADGLEQRGIAALMVFFATALALPSGIVPGLNTLFALPLVPLMGQQALGHDRAWLPQNIRQKQLDRDRTAALILKLLPALDKLEKLLKPRLLWATQGPVSRFFGVIGALMALFASIPVPLTHTVPGIGLLLMAAGLTLHDGLAVIAGAVIGMGYILLLLAALAIFGPQAIDMLHHFIHHLMHGAH